MASVANKREIPVVKAAPVKRAVKAPAAPKAAVAAAAVRPSAQATARAVTAKAVTSKAVPAKLVTSKDVRSALKPGVAAKAILPVLLEKPRKAKLVRDSFTMPEAEYAVLGLVKKACLKAGIDVKKSQLLRIGLALLNQADVPTLKKMISELPPLKAGRPKKE